VRISAVGFLNAAPLWWGLRAGRHPEGWNIAFDLPSACAGKLRSGEADVGLVPSIEFGRDPRLMSPVPLCVAARREVTSVLLFHGGDPEGIGRVSLDPASRTSQVLTRILLERRFGIRPEYREWKVPTTVPQEGRAVLVIGDRALGLSREWAEVPRLDLAHMWNEETGLPFVFALWAAREEALAGAAAPVLLESHGYARGRMGEMAAEFSGRLGLEEGLLRSYLEDHLHFELGEPERRSLDLFLSLAAEGGHLAGEGPGEGGLRGA